MFGKANSSPPCSTCLQPRLMPSLFVWFCVSQPLLHQLCYKHCADKGAAFMATQFSYECFCSEHWDLDYERHGETECDMACMGDEVRESALGGAGHLWLLQWRGKEESRCRR